MGSMKYIRAQILDKKAGSPKRFRNILAASGKLLESGEIRDVANMFVMGRDGKLIKIADLNTDPDKQTEEYSVKAQADHGDENDWGEPMATIEKVFGHCRVWLEEDGLHARMYFAENDALADHAFAISEEASYSIGFDIYPDGYAGADNAIEGEVGILREISMVVTGNDPRAKTIDHKATATGSKGAAAANGIKKLKKGYSMPKELKDKLTAGEAEALKNVIGEAIDGAVEGSEDEPDNGKPADDASKANDNKDNKGEDANGETTDKAPAAKKDMLSPTVVVVKDRVEVKQERGTSSKVTDYLKTDKAVATWGYALVKNDKVRSSSLMETFRELAKVRDGVELGANVSVVPEAVITSIAEQMSDEGTIFGLVNKTGLKFEVGGIAKSDSGTTGHIRGNTKKEVKNTLAKRVLTPEDLYRLIKLDHSMVKINGGLGSSAIVKYVLNILPRKLVEAIDQAILVGGIKNDDEDETEFTAITSILADIKDTNSICASVYEVSSGDNARATISKAAAKITSGSNRVLVTTQDHFTDIENSLAGTNLLFPNGINKNEPNINGISKILTPMFLTKAMLGGFDAIIVDPTAFHTVGDSTPESFADYQIDTNKYAWEAVACIGGGLMNANAAVGIKSATASA